jgi:hypothetical protein
VTERKVLERELLAAPRRGRLIEPKQQLRAALEPQSLERSLLAQILDQALLEVGAIPIDELRDAVFMDG